MEELRTAIVGLGWAALNRHIPALRRHKDFRLCGVIDPKLAVTSAAALQFDLPLTSNATSLESVPWIGEIDAVILTTPPTSHAALASQALALGKHVLVEKPMALRVADAQDMAQAASTARKSLAVAHNFLFCRSFTKLRRDIQTGRLGRLLSVSSTHYANPSCAKPLWYSTNPDIAFQNEAVHSLYLLRALAQGEMRLCHARGHLPAFAQALYTDEKDLPLSFMSRTDACLSEWHFIVIGEKTAGLVDLYRDIYIHLGNDQAHRMADAFKTSFSTIAQHGFAHAINAFAMARGVFDYGTSALYDRFSASIASGSQDPEIGFDAGVTIAKLLNETSNMISRNAHS